MYCFVHIVTFINNINSSWVMAVHRSLLEIMVYKEMTWPGHYYFYEWWKRKHPMDESSLLLNGYFLQVEFYWLSNINSSNTGSQYPKSSVLPKYHSVFLRNNVGTFSSLTTSTNACSNSLCYERRKWIQSFSFPPMLLHCHHVRLSYVRSGQREATKRQWFSAMQCYIHKHNRPTHIIAKANEIIEPLRVSRQREPLLQHFYLLTFGSL